VSLLIVGASARAAAWSALRAGLAPAAADLFADRDLAAVAPCVRVAPGAYPDGLLAAADALPAGPWVYTGAVENRPALVERLADRRPLWGCDAPTLRAVRDPLAVASALHDAGLPTPAVRLDPASLPRDGTWLCKPLASAGGHGIEPLNAASDAAKAGVYYQFRVTGRSLSAVFVGTRGGAVLAGVTRQLVGRPGAEFAYRGTLAPWPVGAEVTRRVGAIGHVLATRFGLVGLFGVDLILAADDTPWLVEVNPRYTASVEVIELAIGRALLADHRSACLGLPLGTPVFPTRRPQRFVAKEVLFARADGAYAGDNFDPSAFAADPFRVPPAADLPHAGTAFSAGEPVLTVFAEGASPVQTLRSLARARAAREPLIAASHRPRRSRP